MEWKNGKMESLKIHTTKDTRRHIIEIEKEKIKNRKVKKSLFSCYIIENERSVILSPQELLKRSLVFPLH
jgi:hypothetical protein